MSNLNYWSIGYAILIVTVYGFIPVFALKGIYGSHAIQLAILSFISAFAFIIGCHLPLLDQIKLVKLKLNFNTFVSLLMVPFLLVTCYILLTAPNIPIFAAIRGSSQQDLALMRESFLKTRTGLDSYLGYIIGVINGYFMPLLIALLEVRRTKYRWLIYAIFFGYSVSFLEKAYFMKMGVPLFFVNMLRQKNKRKYVVKSSLVIMVILFLMFYITGFHSSGDQNSSPFLSITYAPDNIILSVAWRSLVVPLITALDAIDVFYSKFGGSLLWGDTSSFIAFLKGTSQINFERILYQYQFGGMKSGNANQVFILEAFVNFGYLGLLCFAFILGQIVRILYRKNSLAYISVIPMIQYNLFMTGLIGNMLSNGLLLFLLFILVFDLPKMQYKKRIYGKASSISEF